MEARIDLLQWLAADMSLSIFLMCLDDPADLIRASSVSRFWRHYVISNGLCKRLCLRIFPQLATIAHVIEPIGGVQISTDVGTSNSMEWDALERDHRVYASLSRAITSFKVIDCIAHAISASSTDRYPDESIINTLDPRDRILRRTSYWSSKGHSNPEVPERLIYKLKADFCVVTEINIQPFQAYFQPGHPIYSAKSVRFRVGHPKPLSDIESHHMQLPLQQCADDKFLWTYTSQEFPMVQENHLQNFKLPEPLLCIGGYLQVELLGRVQRQETDSLFYLCVSHVRVLGRPLFPAFDVEILETSGRFSLKYNADAFNRTLQSLSDSPDETSSVLPEPSPEERVLGHFEGLVEFLIHGHEPGAELIEWDDAENE